MLQLRVEGDPAESQALLERLTACGVEVQVGASKARREGFTHTYAVVRLPDWAAPAGPAAPVRAYAWVDRPALPAGDRRPERRSR